jgi:hypothetical protein
MRLPEPAAVAAALDAAYAGITDVVAELDDAALLAPTGCRGWFAVDLLLHLTGDAQRALVALATPAPGPADVDFVSYWRSPGCADAAASTEHAQWVRRTAAAFHQPTGVVRLWRDTAPAAARAAAAAVRDAGTAAPLFRPVEVAVFTGSPGAGAAHPAGPTAHVATQGLVIALPDFLATLVTEAVIHHLDLIRHLPDAPVPAEEAMAAARSTLDGLAPSGRLPEHWGPHEALLKATGRAPFDDTDRRSLGADAAHFPLLG